MQRYDNHFALHILLGAFALLDRHSLNVCPLNLSIKKKKLRTEQQFLASVLDFPLFEIVFRFAIMLSLKIVGHLQVKKWNLSFASIWNSVVWLVLVNFFVKIVTATAQGYLKKQQEKELDDLTKTLSSPINSSKSDKVSQ